MKLNSGGIKHPKETFQDAKLSAVNQKRTDNTIAKRKKDKKINNDLQYFTQKTKDHRVSRSPLKSMG